MTLIVYIGKVDKKIETPVVSPAKEGILDWKKLEWITNPNNLGIASNIPIFLPIIKNLDRLYYFNCIYEGNNLIETKELPYSIIKPYTK